MATQIQPPLIDKETMVLFASTLRASYYEKMVRNATKSFTDMVVSGELIESSIKNDKLEARDNSNSNKGGLAKKNE